MLEHLQNHEAQLLMKLTTRTCAVLMPLNPFSSLRMKLWIASCGGWGLCHPGCSTWDLWCWPDQSLQGLFGRKKSGRIARSVSWLTKVYMKSSRFLISVLPCTWLRPPKTVWGSLGTQAAAMRLHPDKGGNAEQFKVRMRPTKHKR